MSPTTLTHFLPRSLSTSSETQAMWALQPRGDLVVFVHGFNGSALGTWLDFPSLLQTESSTAGLDVLFYGYDGLKTRAAISASLFLDFLDGFLSSPLMTINSSLPAAAPQRTDPVEYSRIFLVAHSLGAVVARQALLDAHARAVPWLPRVLLLLFAPAHLGADIVELLSSTVLAVPFPVAKMAPGAAKIRYKVLRDLEPSSRAIQDLERNTNLALKNGHQPHLVAREVIHGENDSIIIPGRFAEDPPLRVFRGQSHTSLCKPCMAFLDPFTLLTAALS